VFLQHQVKPRMTVVEFFEGSRTIGRELEERFEGVQVIGVDRRGRLYTGTRHGEITAAVQHDLGKESAHNQIQAVARKAGISVRQWAMAWMSPECTPLVPVNAMNQKKGAAHGRWAQTELNKDNAQPGRVELEEEYLRETVNTARMMLEALEQEPGLSFALEHPANSDLWTIFKEVITRNAPKWRVVNVDQCAYGRELKKPTKILTNVSGWQPRGLTGTGRCVIGKCAGTKDNLPGNKNHRQQIVANTADRRMSLGGKTGSRREVVRDVAAMMVQPGIAVEVLMATDAWHKREITPAAPAGARAAARPPRGGSGRQPGGAQQ
jgi:hypothetical protein